MGNYRIDKKGRKVWDFGLYSAITQEFRDKEFNPNDRLNDPLCDGSFKFKNINRWALCSHNSRKIRMQCKLCDELDSALGM